MTTSRGGGGAHGIALGYLEQLERYREMICRLYRSNDEHIGSLWYCLDMTHDEYLAWKECSARRRFEEVGDE